MARQGAEVRFVVRRLLQSRRECFAYYGLREHPRLRFVSLSLPFQSEFNDWHGRTFRFYLAPSCAGSAGGETLLLTRDPAGPGAAAAVHRVRLAPGIRTLFEVHKLAFLTKAEHQEERGRSLTDPGVRAKVEAPPRSRGRGLHRGGRHRLHVGRGARRPRRALPWPLAGVRRSQRHPHRLRSRRHPESRSDAGRPAARSRHPLRGAAVPLEGRGRLAARTAALAGAPADAGGRQRPAGLGPPARPGRRTGPRVAGGLRGPAAAARSGRPTRPARASASSRFRARATSRRPTSPARSRPSN